MKIIGVYPAGIGGVVAGGEPPAADGGRVVADIEHGPARRWPLDRTDQHAGSHHEPGLLTHLAHDRLRVALPRLDPAAGQRPAARLGLVPTLDQQQPPVVIGDDGAHTLDPRRSWHHASIAPCPGRVLDVCPGSGQRRYP